MNATQPPRLLNRMRWLLMAVIGGALLVVWRRMTLSAGKRATISLPPTTSVAPLSNSNQVRRTSPQVESFSKSRLLLLAMIATLLVWLLVNVSAPSTGLALMILVAAVLNRPRVLAAGAIGLMIDSAVSFRSVIQLWELDVPVMLMLLAGVALWGAMQLDWREFRIPALPVPTTKARVFAGWGELHLGVFLLGTTALAEFMRINAFPGLTGEAISETVDTQHGLLFTGVTLVILGLGGARLPRRIPAVHWPTVLGVVGIMALGLGVRFWQLDNTTRFFIDELFFADTMRYFWEWRTIPLAAPLNGIAAEPILFPYWQSLAVDIFGRNFVGLRAASAIIGTLTVGAAYLLGRTLFDRKTALLAALLLATFPPHIHFSRIGLSEIAMTLFGTLALTFLARGLATNRRLDYALGGAMLGMTHYFHEGGKFLYTPLAVVWLAGVWMMYRPRVPLKNFLIAVLACLLVAMPIYSTLLANQKPLAARFVANEAGLGWDYWQRLLETGDFGQHIQDHVIPPFLLYIQRWDNSLFYGGNSPLMRAFVTPTFLLGVFYVLRRWRAPGPMLMILWVLSTSLGNSLLVESGGVPRFVVVFPALMVLVAVGIRYTLPLIWPEEADNGQRSAASHRITVRGRTLLIPYLRTNQAQFLLMIVLVIGMSVAQVDYYFNRHIPVYNRQYRDHWGHRDAQDAVLRSLHFPPGTQIHIITRTDPPDELVTRGMLDFMATGLSLNVISSKDGMLPEYVASLNHDVDHAFYVGPYNTPAIELLRRHFDLLPPQVSPYDLPADYQFVLYYAPSVQ